MDVTTSRFPDVPEVSSPRRVIPVKPSEPTAEAEESPRAKARTDEWEPRSSLKFSVIAADVDAKFEIHEATSRVIVTMYEQRDRRGASRGPLAPCP